MHWIWMNLKTLRWISSNNEINERSAVERSSACVAVERSSACVAVKDKELCLEMLVVNLFLHLNVSD
jgi:hypothetical protein